jgi:hypothetical protein
MAGLDLYAKTTRALDGGCKASAEIAGHNSPMIALSKGGTVPLRARFGRTEMALRIPIDDVQAYRLMAST